MAQSKYMKHYIQAIPHMRTMFTEYVNKHVKYPKWKRQAMIDAYNKSLDIIEGNWREQNAKK